MATEDKKYLYVAIGIGVLGVFGAFVMGGAYSLLGAILAGIGATLTMGLYKYGYIIIPTITKTTKTSVVLTEDMYEVPSTQDAIVRNINGVYYATVFLGVKVFESMSEKSPEELQSYNSYFERAISNIRSVAKISYMVYVEDITEKRRNIEVKRAEVQLRLARERDKTEPDVLRIDKLERELAVWDVQLGQIQKGMKPMGVVAYAMTTAGGVSKEGAIASARAQANELRSILSNSLNVEVDILTADEMLKCFQWEKFLPLTPKELEESVI